MFACGTAFGFLLCGHLVRKIGYAMKKTDHAVCFFAFSGDVFAREKVPVEQLFFERRALYGVV